MKEKKTKTSQRGEANNTQTEQKYRQGKERKHICEKKKETKTEQQKIKAKRNRMTKD